MFTQEELQQLSMSSITRDIPVITEKDARIIDLLRHGVNTQKALKDAGVASPGWRLTILKDLGMVRKIGHQCNARWEAV